MIRWASVAAIALLVMVVTILAFQPAPVDRPTNSRPGCPPEWVYANDCGFIWHS